MQLVKCLFFLVIIVISGYIGKLLSKKFVDRLKELEEMKNALNIFESKIKFTYEPITEVFEDISNMCDKNISDIFRKTTKYLNEFSAGLAWEKALDESKNNLKDADKEVLKMLSNLLRTN